MLTLALCAVCTLRVQAGEPESETFIERGRSLFDYGRWSDARHEFLRARDVLAPSDRVAAQTVDFYLAACAVELGSRDAEGALRDFEARYPGSVYANDVRFSLGSLYCAEGDMRRAREAFAEDRLQGAEPLTQGAVRHPHGLCRIHRRQLRQGFRLF
ncbi:MAG: tetratricopeptide repeat protein [Alistipes onderdonkii]